MVTLNEISGQKRREEAVSSFEGQKNSFWFGRGESMLNLSGRVNPHTLHNLLEGKAPNGKVIQNEFLYRESILKRDVAFSHRLSAWRFDFHAPSDLSNLALNASPKTEKLLKDLWYDSVKNSILEFDRSLGQSAFALFAVKHLETNPTLEKGLESSAFLVNSKFLESGRVATFNSQEITKAAKSLDQIQTRLLSQSLADDWGLIVNPTRDGFSIQGASALCRTEEGKLSKLISSALSISPSDALIRSHREQRSRAVALIRSHREQRSRPLDLKLVKDCVKEKSHEQTQYWNRKEVRDQIKETIPSERNAPSRSKDSSEGRGFSR